MSRCARGLAALLVAASLAAPALATNQPLMLGSVLVYPLFDVNDGTIPGQIGAPKASTFKISNLAFAPVEIRLVRVCRGIKSFGGRGWCQGSGRRLIMTPRETAVRDVASFFDVHRPTCPTGFIVAYASDPNRQPIVWDRLIGSMHIQGQGPLNQRSAAYQALAFQTAGMQMQGAPVAGATGGAFPNLPFDGVGFEQLPARLHTDFLATAGTRYSELILMTLDIQAVARNWPTFVALDWYNQAEEPFSGGIEYVCHVRVRLDDQINPAQPGAGVAGGGLLTAAGLGSPYGLLQLEALGRDAALGLIAQVGGNRLTLRPLGQRYDATKPALFIAR